MNLTPSETQGWALVVQALTLFVLTLTLVVVTKYAWDTAQIAKAAVEQRDLMHRPLVQIKQFQPRNPIHIAAEQGVEEMNARGEALPPEWSSSRPAAALLPESFDLQNVGVGPAIEVELWKVDSSRSRTTRTFYPHLKVDESIGVGLRLGHEKGKWGMDIEYRSLVGAIFVSSYELDGSVVRGFSTRLVKSPR